MLCRNLRAHRFGVQWGPQGERKRTSDAYWRKPLTWNKQRWMQCLDCGHRESLRTIKIADGRFSCSACGSTNVEPTRQRVFCASLADVFEDRPELISWRIDLFDLIKATPNLDWLLLTKRPKDINPMLFGLGYGRILSGSDWLPNLWLGTSVENQEQANKRIPALLLARGAAVRFLSCEPMLGRVDLTSIPIFASSTIASTLNALTDEEPVGPYTGFPRGSSPAIDWVICGGESGPHARPMHPDWAQSLRDQCQAHGTPFFFKQWGESLPRGQMDAEGMESLMYAAGCEAFGGTAPKRSIQWDTEHWAYWRGKHKAGRLLDGVQWDQYPK